MYAVGVVLEKSRTITELYMISEHLRRHGLKHLSHLRRAVLAQTEQGASHARWRRTPRSQRST